MSPIPKPLVNGDTQHRVGFNLHTNGRRTKSSWLKKSQNPSWFFFSQQVYTDDRDNQPESLQKLKFLPCDRKALSETWNLIRLLFLETALGRGFRTQERKECWFARPPSRVEGPMGLELIGGIPFVSKRKKKAHPRSSTLTKSPLRTPSRKGFQGIWRTTEATKKRSVNSTI